MALSKRNKGLEKTAEFSYLFIRKQCMTTATEYRPRLDRGSIGSQPTYHRYLTDIPPTISRSIRRPTPSGPMRGQSTDISVDISVEYSPSIDRYSIDTRRSIDRYSIDTRPSRDRYIDRSIDRYHDRGPPSPWP